MSPRVGRVLALCISAVYEALLYIASCIGPVTLIYSLRSKPLAVLIGLALIGYSFVGLLFMLLLVLTRRVLFRSLRTGEISIKSMDGQRWFLAAILMGILYRSPFQTKTVGISLFAAWFFRGMGARMPESTFLGHQNVIRDPWFLEMGENVSTGSGVLFLGHIGHNQKLFLGKIVIGDDVVIGIRTIIFPDVRIGNHVRIGAGSIVVRGTTIPDGETWVGVPARKLQRHEPEPEARTAVREHASSMNN